MFYILFYDILKRRFELVYQNLDQTLPNTKRNVLLSNICLLCYKCIYLHISESFSVKTLRHIFVKHSKVQYISSITFLIFNRTTDKNNKIYVIRESTLNIIR